MNLPNQSDSPGTDEWDNPNPRFPNGETSESFNQDGSSPARDLLMSLEAAHRPETIAIDGKWSARRTFLFVIGSCSVFWLAFFYAIGQLI